MNLLRPNGRALAGALAGGGSAVVAALLANVAGRETPFTALMVLVVALVGLGLGAAAAVYAYAAAGFGLFALSAVVYRVPTSTPADVLRYGAFIVGTPFVILLALRAERERHATLAARDVTEAAIARVEAERTETDRARRQVDDALRDAQRERARLEEVAESIPEPLIVYDAASQGTYGNRAALRLFGRSFFERPLDEWGRAARPRDEAGDPLPPGEWPQVAAQRSPIRRRVIVRLPMSGRDLIVDVEGTPIPGGGCVLLLRDVGKEEDERRRLSQFASFVAHELRNPLAVAKARAELTLREAGLSDRSRVHTERSLESVDAAIGILERLELYSRADAGHIEARLEPFQLGAAVEAALERLRARGSEREVMVRGPIDTQALGDRHLAEQAITNVLTNADRYSEPNAPIEIEIQGGDPVAVRVSDAGPGISDEVAGRLFRDRVAGGRGLGLGLYLVAATMSAQGGSVQLEQRRPAAIFVLRWRRASISVGVEEPPAVTPR
ncbi:MAG: hypothetical protein DLM71_02705 [Chloroflexi bacterium]|nr:MAG: hypothetical protein DLM71_02705 [Chloroflexota bacterium]